MACMPVRSRPAPVPAYLMHAGLGDCCDAQPVSRACLSGPGRPAPVPTYLMHACDLAPGSGRVDGRRPRIHITGRSAFLACLRVGVRLPRPAGPGPPVLTDRQTAPRRGQRSAPTKAPVLAEHVAHTC